VEQIKIWEDSLNSNFIYFKSKKELLDYISFNNVNYFCIDDKNITDYKTNFAYIDISKKLYINEEFYRENKQELDKYFIQNMIFASNIIMSKHIYSEDLIRKLIYTETIVFEQEIEISKETIEFLFSKCIRLFIKNGDDIVGISTDESLGTHK
jgi:Na+/phosphate symporter